MAKSPLMVIYHLCFARFQLLGAVRRPAVLISFAKRSPWRLDFSTISRLTVLLETHQQNKRFLKWGFTCRVLFLFFEFSFFSIYFEQTKTGNSETNVGFWWHLYKTPNFIGTSDDWFAGYKHGCQTKKVMPGSVQDVARPGGFFGPTGKAWRFKGFKGLTVPNIQKTLEVVPFVLHNWGVGNHSFCWDVAESVGWVDKDFFLEPNQKRSKFR